MSKLRKLARHAPDYAFISFFVGGFVGVFMNMKLEASVLAPVGVLFALFCVADLLGYGFKDTN